VLNRKDNANLHATSHIQDRWQQAVKFVNSIKIED